MRERDSPSSFLFPPPFASLLPSPRPIRATVFLSRPSFLVLHIAFYAIRRDAMRSSEEFRVVRFWSAFLHFHLATLVLPLFPPVPTSFPSSFPVFSCARVERSFPSSSFYCRFTPLYDLGVYVSPKNLALLLDCLLSRLSRLPHSLSYNTRCNIGFY